MAGKRKSAPEPYKDVKELNWEEKEVPEQKMEVSIPKEWEWYTQTYGPVSKETIEAWGKVDPDLRSDNPVWKYSCKDGKYIFIFQTGQKVRI